jgi:hypothetical protein
MSDIITRIKKNYHLAGTIFIFFIAFLLFALIMPGERKFIYDFVKGKPWEHDNLNAPFDFPIHKTVDELKAEEDTVLANLRLYFSFKAEVLTGQLNSFSEDFNKDWIAFSMRAYRIDSAGTYLESGRYSALRDLQEQFSGIFYILLEKMYYTGIVEIPELSMQINPASEIVVVKSNIADYKQLSELYTPKSAYEHIRSRIRDELKASGSRQLNRYTDFLENYPVEKYLVANIFYDEISTERERAQLLQQISLTKGKIQNAERIISDGEIITPEKYQILTSLKEEYEQQKGNVNALLVSVGKLIFVVISLILLYAFLYNFRKELLEDMVKTSFILFMMLLMFAVAVYTTALSKVSFYIIPFTILPIVLRTFFDERVAVFVHVLTTLLISIIAPRAYEFIVLNTFAGIVAIFSLTNLYRRSRFFLSALFVIITYSLTYAGISVMHEGTLGNIDALQFVNFGINGVMILISFLLIYVFEKAFGFLSDTTLMELSDTNQPLLRKLAEVAPGTFQHCMQVANLSEEVIYRIGGNPLLVRTGALYHDIGKMYDPIYFIENQTSGINPHDNLEFEDSAIAIINHVSKGVELARKNKLPEAIIDFIKTHHGTTMVQYFYKSYIKKYPDQEVDLLKFTYPGPRPSSKEMAVLMMADSVEAASRSLSNYSDESISELVEKIISSQLKERQFEEAPINFRDISTAKEVFNTRLRNIYHARISYPQ